MRTLFGGGLRRQGFDRSFESLIALVKPGGGSGELVSRAASGPGVRGLGVSNLEKDLLSMASATSSSQSLSLSLLISVLPSRFILDELSRSGIGAAGAGRGRRRGSLLNLITVGATWRAPHHASDSPCFRC